MKKFTAIFLSIALLISLFVPFLSLAETTTTTKDATTTNTEEAKSEFILFNIDKMENAPFKFEPYKGKALLVSMFTTWCPYCVKEIPEFLKFQQEHSDSMQVLMVHVPSNETFETAQKYWKDHNLEELTLLSDTGFMASAFQVQGFPTNMIFDKDGKMVLYAYGLTYDDIKTQMEKIGVEPNKK